MPVSPSVCGLDVQTADFAKHKKAYGELTYVCDLAAIPVESERYDLVLLTQVLEHIPEPLRVLDELGRVLKAGGQLWLTQPFYYEEHEQPYDFYRYTQFGLKHLLDRAGFEVAAIEWLEGYSGTLVYQLELAGRHLPVRAAHYGGGGLGITAALLAKLLRPTFRQLSRLFAHLDVRHKFVKAGHCKNYCVIARKRAPSADVPQA